MRSRRTIILLVSVCVTVLLVALSPTLSARPGGVGSGTEEYDCGGSCHTVQGSAVVTMWASDMTPSLSGDVRVIVNITGGQATNVIGAMIVSALSPVASSIPTNAGWTIVQDPSATQTTDNYYENYSYAGSISMEWKLKAPSTEGIYTLYARAMHGGGSEFYEDYVEGLVFTVGGATLPATPKVVISSVTQDETLEGTVKVDVTVLSNKSIAYTVLTLGSTVIGNDTSEPYSFTLDTKQFADGSYKLNVTAVDSEGNHGSKEIDVSISNSAESEQLISWVWTMAAGTIAILAWIGIFIVIALMIRRRTVKRGAK